MKKFKARKNLKQQHRNTGLVVGSAPIRSTMSLKAFANSLGWKKSKDRWVKA